MNGRELRDAFGAFATGVCLVTTLDKQQKPVAITVNSFSSLSLEPPLVLWSLQNDSDMFQEFSSPKSFNISVLNSGQEELSSYYAMKDQHQILPEHFTAGSNGMPVIDGALETFECNLETTVAGGDHLIIVGRVTEVNQGAGGEPLLFYKGQYRMLGC